MTLQDLAMTAGFWGSMPVGAYVAFTRFHHGLLASLGLGVASGFAVAAVLLMFFFALTVFDAKAPVSKASAASTPETPAGAGAESEATEAPHADGDDKA